MLTNEGVLVSDRKIEITNISFRIMLVRSF